MKIKATFVITILALMIFSMTLSVKAQENYYGQTKVELYNGFYFLIPDSYIATTDLYPIIEGKEQITKTYKNNKTAANIQFTAFKLPDNDKTLKEMGIEKYITDKMNKILNIKSAKTIDMNGRDTFFLRGETKQNYIMESYHYGSNSTRSTSTSTVKLEVVMYIIKEGEYVYVSCYQTPTHYFATHLRTFLEIQNSFTNGK